MLVLLNGLTALPKGRFDGWRIAWRGYRCGRRARYLPAVEDWDRLLRLPLGRARTELGVTPAESYVPLELEEVFVRFAGAQHD